MKSNRKIFFVFVMIFMMLSITTVIAGAELEDEQYSGLTEIGGYSYYYNADTHEKFTVEKDGFYTVDSKTYFFYASDSHIEKSGKVSKFVFANQSYLLNADGSLVKYSGAIATVGNNKYYVNVKNELMLGFQSINNDNYYFDPSTGAMVKGLKVIDGKTYYFDSVSGVTKKGFQTANNSTYYFDPSTGAAFKGLKVIGEDKYYFDSVSGKMNTGWHTIKDKKYYFGAKSGKMYKGLKKIGADKYYFSSNGVMKTGWRTINGKKYYFGTKSGKMYKGVKKIGDYRYCFKTSGVMKTGWVTYNNDKYYFQKKSGRAVTGWNKIGDNYYYFTSAGKMRTNRIVGSYYVLSDGRRATSEAVKRAVNVVKSVSKSGMSKEDKLNACFYWIINNCSYERNYTNPANLKSRWTETYATQLFKSHLGNCYRYASAMAYCAEVLGYKAKVAIGKISSSGGMTNHGWTEITIDSKTYIYDAVQQDYSKGNYRKRTYSNYPKKLQKEKSYSIVLS